MKKDKDHPAFAEAIVKTIREVKPEGVGPGLLPFVVAAIFLASKDKETRVIDLEFCADMLMRYRSAAGMDLMALEQIFAAAAQRGVSTTH